MNKIYNPSREDWKSVLKRPTQSVADIEDTVTTIFTEVEKAALAYCDVLSEGKSKNFQSYHDDLSVHFNEKEIAEIASVVINMNLWTRLKLAQGATPFIQN